MIVTAQIQKQEIIDLIIDRFSFLLDLNIKNEDVLIQVLKSDTDEWEITATVEYEK